MKMNKIISLGCLLACASAIIDVASSSTESNLRGTRAVTTVTTSDELITALANHATDIDLAAGTYNAPADGAGFQILDKDVRITGAAGLASIINCGGSKTAFGFDIQNDAVITGVSVQFCSTGVQISSGKVTLDSVSVTNNFNNVGRGSGIHILFGATVDVVDSNISDNNGYAGIYNYGTLTVLRCTITRNIGTGITSRYSSHVNVTSSQIVYNYGSGLFASEYSFLSAFSSNISANYGAYTGGGVGAFNSYIYIVDCTIVGNSARVGGGIYFAGLLSNYFVSASTVVSGNSADLYGNIYNPSVPCQGPSGAPGSLPCNQ